MDYPTSGRPACINRMLSLQEWAAYVAGYDFGPVPPTRLVLHHTYIPNQDQWRGLISMRGMQSYYAGMGWKATPHVFAGPDGIWLMTPMSKIGIHAGTGNSGYEGGKLWYSIGLEMVGFFDHMRPAGAVWEHAKAVMGGLSKRLGIAPRELISFHRDYTTLKSCPGWAVTKEWVFGEMDAWMAANTPTAGKITAESQLLVPGSRVTAEQCIRYILAHPHGEYDEAAVREIVGAYEKVCQVARIDLLLAIAQMVLETGNLTSWWSQRPWRNPAGIGATGAMSETRPAAGDWVYHDGVYWEGCTFKSWKGHAVPAHIGRLLAYALRDDQATPEQLSLIRYALSVRPLVTSWRGIARTPGRFGTTWARVADYGDRWARVANEILAFR